MKAVKPQVKNDFLDKRMNTPCKDVEKKPAETSEKEA
jgi:hypothetical protein